MRRSRRPTGPAEVLRARCATRRGRRRAHPSAPSTFARAVVGAPAPSAAIEGDREAVSVAHGSPRQTGRLVLGRRIDDPCSASTRVTRVHPDRPPRLSQPRSPVTARHVDDIDRAREHGCRRAPQPAAPGHPSPAARPRRRSSRSRQGLQPRSPTRQRIVHHARGGPGSQAARRPRRDASARASARAVRRCCRPPVGLNLQDREQSPRSDPAAVGWIAQPARRKVNGTREEPLFFPIYEAHSCRSHADTQPVFFGARPCRDVRRVARELGCGPIFACSRPLFQSPSVRRRRPSRWKAATRYVKAVIHGE